MVEKAKNILNTFDVDKWILRVCLFFPISTVIQGISIFNPINKLLIGILILFLIFALFKRINTQKYVLVVLFSISFCLGVILSSNFDNGVNNLFYFLIFGLFTIYLIYDFQLFIENFKRDKKLIFYSVLIWTAIVGISLFIPSSYMKFKSGWGDDAYFMSFTQGSPHRIASSACFVMVLVHYLIKEHKVFDKYKFGLFALLIVPLLTVLLAGARIYLIIALLIFVITYYTVCNNPKLFWLSGIPLGLAGAVLIFLSPMGTKIVSVFTSNKVNDLMFRFTNGRSEFWTYDLLVYSTGTLFNRLFGFGVSYVFDINNILLNQMIYAHNDYINIMITYGVFGLGLYFVAITLFLKTFIKQSKRMPAIIGISLFTIYFASAFLNGFYVYPCTLLSFPILMYFANPANK